jgi:hypothetical protein
MDANMQRRVRAHGVADDVSLVHFQGIHHRQNVVARDILTVARAIFRHIGWRITALAVGDAAMRTGEETHLHLPRAMIARILVHEDHR